MINKIQLKIGLTLSVTHIVLFWTLENFTPLFEKSLRKTKINYMYNNKIGKEYL